MAIVLDTAPVGAISTYSRLLDEVRDLSDNDAYAEDKIQRAISKAEKFFARKLRGMNMEVTETLAVEAATVTLPAACRELRAVIWVGDGEFPLKQMTLATLASTFNGYEAEYPGYPSGFAVEGRTLRFGRTGTGSARITYYADIPALSDDAPTNWLLTYAPDLYVAGVMHRLCTRERDSEGVQMWLQEALVLLASVQEEGTRFSYGTMHPTGLAQVRGARI
jgi:hypothetical protein